MLTPQPLSNHLKIKCRSYSIKFSMLEENTSRNTVTVIVEPILSYQDSLKAPCSPVNTGMFSFIPSNLKFTANITKPMLMKDKINIWWALDDVRSARFCLFSSMTSFLRICFEITLITKRITGIKNEESLLVYSITLILLQISSPSGQSVFWFFC